MDLLHAWWLLRLLFIFLLACPFLIIPVLFGFLRKRPDAEDRTEAPAEHGARVEISAIKVVTALFPFKPALQAMTAALDSAGPGIGGPLLHLAILIVAYGLIARFALRRFATV